MSGAANDTTAGEGVLSLPSRDGDVTSIAQVAQCIIMNVEERDGWADDGGLVTIRCHAEVIRDDALALAAQPSAGAQGYVTDEWAERFCEAVNWSPDGQECKVVEGEMRCTTFREIAKGHILAVIATDPHPLATPAQPDTGDVAEAREWLIGQRRIQASAAVRNGDKTINHTQIVGFIDLCLAALSKPNAPGSPEDGGA